MKSHINAVSGTIRIQASQPAPSSEVRSRSSHCSHSRTLGWLNLTL